MHPDRIAIRNFIKPLDLDNDGNVNGDVKDKSLEKARLDRATESPRDLFLRPIQSVTNARLYLVLRP